MIKVKIERSSDGFVQGFKVSGHAGYAKYGEDIICSAVSSVVLTAVGYAESVYNPEDKEDLRCFEEYDGLIVWNCPEITESVRRELKPVFDAMVYGLKQICESYGKKYLVVFD